MAGELFDASALVDCLVTDAAPPPDVAYGEHSLDLALYEAGNSIWNIGIAQDRLSSDEIQRAMDSLARLVDEITLATAAELDLQRTIDLASDEGLTFYDTAYLFVAQRDGRRLVTEDKALRNAAAEYVPVATVTDLVES